MCLSIPKCSSLVDNWQIKTLQTDTCNLTHGNLMEGVGPPSLLVPCYTLSVCKLDPQEPLVSMNIF